MITDAMLLNMRAEIQLIDFEQILRSNIIVATRDESNNVKQHLHPKGNLTTVIEKRILTTSENSP